MQEKKWEEAGMEKSEGRKVFGKNRKKKVPSIKAKMIGIVLMCWFLPFALVIGGMGYYILSKKADNKARCV